jgi:hypothetical protein
LRGFVAVRCYVITTKPRKLKHAPLKRFQIFCQPHITREIRTDENQSLVCVAEQALFGGGGFDFDKEFGSRETRHTEQRAGVPGSGCHEAFHDYNAVCEESFEIGRVDVQADDIAKSKTRRAEHLLEVIDGLIELSAEVAGMHRFAFGIDGNLSGAVKHSLPAAHFMPLYEPESILPFPRVDNSSLQFFLPGHTVAYVLDYFAITRIPWTRRTHSE